VRDLVERLPRAVELEVRDAPRGAPHRVRVHAPHEADERARTGQRTQHVLALVGELGVIERHGGGVVGAAGQGELSQGVVRPAARRRRGPTSPHRPRARVRVVRARSRGGALRAGLGGIGHLGVGGERWVHVSLLEPSGDEMSTIISRIRFASSGSSTRRASTMAPTSCAPTASVSSVGLLRRLALAPRRLASRRDKKPRAISAKVRRTPLPCRVASGPEGSEHTADLGVLRVGLGEVVAHRRLERAALVGDHPVVRGSEHGLRDERVAILEVVVEAAVRQADLLHQPRDADRVEPITTKEARRRADDLVLHLGLVAVGVAHGMTTIMENGATLGKGASGSARRFP
jgi:hypothetical protein